MQRFIEHAIPYETFWDICCDHGYVGIKALESGLFPEVHFVDQVPHIMQKLESLISQSQHDSLPVFFLHTIGAEKIAMEIKGNMLIAGVGGLTITMIVESLMNKKFLQAQRLLLSPHTDEKVLVNFIGKDIFRQEYELLLRLEIFEGKRMRPLYIFNKRSQTN